MSCLELHKTLSRKQTTHSGLLKDILEAGPGTMKWSSKFCEILLLVPSDSIQIKSSSYLTGKRDSIFMNICFQNNTFIRSLKPSKVSSLLQCSYAHNFLQRRSWPRRISVSYSTKRITIVLAHLTSKYGIGLLFSFEVKIISQDRQSWPWLHHFSKRSYTDMQRAECAANRIIK